MNHNSQGSTIGTGFFNFLYARYALTLARLPDWRLLRSGATCMAGNALACLALAIALMAGTSIEWAEPLLAYIVRVVLIVLGIEFSANFGHEFDRLSPIYLMREGIDPICSGTGPNC